MKCEWDGCPEEATSLLMLGKQSLRLCKKHYKAMDKKKKNIEKEVDKAIKDLEKALGI